jgi:signal transduction histidine kinase
MSVKKIPPPVTRNFNSECEPAAPATRSAAGNGSSPEVRIVIIYLFAASIWIIASDLLLTRFSLQDAQAGLMQSLKGLNFVITTAVLLLLVLRKAYGGWRLAEQQRLALVEQARERINQLCAHLQAQREDDRTRISREIHDELGQLLTGIKMELRLVENRLSDRDDRSLNATIDQLVEISELVDATITAVQRIATGLRPRALDNLGLGPALLEEATQFSQRSQIPCALNLEGLKGELPPEVSTTAFRIFQEALTNVARHAGAHRIDASCGIKDNALQLTVHDDGKGIDPSVLASPKSIGLIGMLERAENVGGTVVFRRGSGKGTELILTVPLAAT